MGGCGAPQYIMLRAFHIVQQNQNYKPRMEVPHRFVEHDVSLLGGQLGIESTTFEYKDYISKFKDQTPFVSGSILSPPQAPAVWSSESPRRQG